MRSLRTRKYAVVLLVPLLLISFSVNQVAASTITTVKTTQLTVAGTAVAKMGACTELFLSYGSDLHPQYYSAAIAIGSTQSDGIYRVDQIRIDVEGWDPLGNRLSSDRFTALSILISPEDDQTVQLVLDAIYYVVLDLAPPGAKAALRMTHVEGGGQTGYGYYAWAKWSAETWGPPPADEKGIRFGYQLAVDHDLEGTYHIRIHYKMYIVGDYPAGGGTTTINYPPRVLTLDLYYGYDASPPGGGCPILSVFDGNDYADEGLLDIHAESDVTRGFLVHTTPAPIGHRYRMKLTEHPQTISHIDQVQLYARLSNGKVRELPLLSAVHSMRGNVFMELLRSDDVRVDTLGADHNNGISEYIDLEFFVPRHVSIDELIFVIQGYNAYGKD